MNKTIKNGKQCYCRLLPRCKCDFCEKLRAVNEVCKNVQICNSCLYDIKEAEDILKRGEREFADKNYKFEIEQPRKLCNF